MNCLQASENPKELEVLKWARENDRSYLICEKAAKGGHLEVLKWAQKNGWPWNKWTCAYAAEEGHLEVLKWAREQVPPCPWDWWTCKEATQ